MSGDLEHYLPVGIMIILLLILSEGYGISPFGVYNSFVITGHSVLSLSGPANSALLTPALLVIAIFALLYLSSNIDLSDIAAVGLVFLFILLVA
ncbi:MAG: hypothetical protein ACE5DI_00790 [Candidatus Micrarchaeia archaeon]